MGEHAEHQAVQPNHGRHPPALIEMRETERGCGQENSSEFAPCHHDELALQVAPKASFLANSGADRQPEPKRELESAAWEQRQHEISQVRNPEQQFDQKYYEGSCHPTGSGNANIARHFADRMPAFTDHAVNRRPSAQYSAQDQREHQPFLADTKEV